MCAEVKAELKRLKELAEAWVKRSDADVNQALRERLLDFSTTGRPKEPSRTSQDVAPRSGCWSAR